MIPSKHILLRLGMIYMTFFLFHPDMLHLYIVLDCCSRGSNIRLRTVCMCHSTGNTLRNMSQPNRHMTNHHNWTYQCMPMTMSSMQDCCCDSMYGISNVYVNRRLLFLCRYHCQHMTHLYTMHMMNQIDNTPHHSTMDNCFPLRTWLMVLNNWYNKSLQDRWYMPYTMYTNRPTPMDRQHSTPYDTMNILYSYCPMVHYNIVSDSGKHV